MKVQLINCSGYKLPVTKRVVSENEIVEVNECEYDKIKETGKFVILTDDNVNIDGFFIQSSEPSNHLPDDWTGKSICLKIIGGLGDALIVASLVASLKIKTCLVTLAVRDNQVELLSTVEGVKEAIDATALNDPKIKCKYDVVLDLNHAFTFGGKIVNADYYEAVHKKAGVVYNGELAKLIIKDEPLKLLDNPVIAIHTGASNPIRRWSNEKWKTLAYKLVNLGFRVLFFGDITDFSFEDVNIRVASLLTRNLVKQAQMLKECSYFIGNDSGFCHLSGVLGLSGQVLFFSTKPEHVISKYKKLAGISKFKELDVEPTRNIVNYDPNYLKCCDAIVVQEIVNNIPENLKVLAKIRTKAVNKSGSKRILNQTLTRSQLNKVSRLLFIVPDVNHGGGEKATSTLIGELSKYFKIDMVNLNYKNKVNPTQPMFVGKYRVLGDSKEEMLHEYLVSNPYDAILFYDWTDLVINVLQNLPLRPPVINICHTEDDSTVNVIRNIKSKVEKVVSVSKKIALDLSCDYIPNAVDFNSLVKGKKLTFSFSDTTLPTLGFIGRFDANKNVVWLIENLSKLKCNLVLAGATDCTDIERLLKLGKDHEVSGKLCILPHTDDVASLYASFDAYVLASNYEGCPLTVLEAALLNVPVLSTNVGMLSDVFKDRETINFFELNPESLNKAVADIGYIDKTKAYDVILNNFSPDEMGNKYRRLIRKLLGSVWPSYIQEGDIKLIRKSGGGDIIMASSVFKKARETFPNALIHVNVPPNYRDLVRYNPHIDDLVEEGEPCDISFDLDYYDCWKEGLHAAEGMGGNVNELELNLNNPKPLIKGSVGIWAYQHNRSIKTTKQLSVSKWKLIVDGLLKGGIECYQLGAAFEERLDFIPNDFREVTLEDSLKNLKRMDVVLCVDCIAQHAAKALNKKCVVIWGGSGYPALCGYDSHTNVFSKTQNKCLASVCHSTYGQPGCCNDGTCTNDVDVNEVVVAILNLLDNKNGTRPI